MKALLAWQLPRTNGSRDLCSLLNVLDNNQKHWRKREGEEGERRTLRDKECTCTCVRVGGSRRVGVTCSLENNDIVLNYNVVYALE